MIIMIIAELSGRCRQSPIVLGGEGQSLGTKDTLSIGPLDTHWSHVFINPVRSIFRQMPGHFATWVNPAKHRESPTPATTNREHWMRIFCTKVFFQSSKQLKQLLQKLKHDQHGITCCWVKGYSRNTRQPTVEDKGDAFSSVVCFL